MSESPHTLVVAPTRAEHQVIGRALSSELLNGQVHIGLLGVGPERATTFCQRLDEQRWRGRLVLAGWAGGLLPHLRPGSVVLARAALSPTGPRCPCSVLPCSGAVAGDILTVDRALYTPGEKTRATQSGAVAVEMEAYPLARWAQAHDLPFYHGRVILDAADESLPDLSGIFAEDDRIRSLELLRQLGRRPKLAWELASLAWRLQRLSPLLAGLARQLAVPR